MKRSEDQKMKLELSLNQIQHIRKNSNTRFAKLSIKLSNKIETKETLIKTIEKELNQMTNDYPLNTRKIELLNYSKL